MLPTSGLRRDRGFTLIELLVALVVLAIVLTGLARVLLYSLQSIGENEQALHANALQTEILEDLQSLPWPAAAIYATDPGYQPVFEGHPTVTLFSPFGTDPQVPTATETFVRNGTEYELTRHIVWVDTNGDASYDVKKFVSLLSWTGRAGVVRTSRWEAERAVKPSERGGSDGPTALNFTVYPDPSTLNGADGTHNDDLQMRVVFDRDVHYAQASYTPYDPVLGVLVRETVPLAREGTDSTTWVGTIPAGTETWSNGTWTFDVSGLDLVSGGAAGETSASVSFSGGPYTCTSCSSPLGGSAPTVAITSPADGDTYTAGTSITFSATASDSEDGDLSAHVDWYLNGALWRSGTSSFASPLNASGTHTVAVEVVDGDGNTATRAISVTINPASSDPPSVTITAPGDGTTQTSSTVTLSASANDTEDGDVSASTTWSSDIDGSLGTGASVSPALSDGTHTITATATDSNGLIDTDSITLVIDTAPPVRIATITVSPDPFSVKGNGELQGDVTVTVTVEGDLDESVGDRVTVSYQHWSGSGTTNDRYATDAAVQLTAGSTSTWRLTLVAGGSGGAGEVAGRRFRKGESVTFVVEALRASDGDNDLGTHGPVTAN